MYLDLLVQNKFKIQCIFIQDNRKLLFFDLCLIPLYRCNATYGVIRSDRILVRPVQVIHPNVHLSELRQL